MISLVRFIKGIFRSTRRVGNYTFIEVHGLLYRASKKLLIYSIYLYNLTCFFFFFFFHFHLRRLHISFTGCIPSPEYFRPSHPFEYIREFVNSISNVRFVFHVFSKNLRILIQVLEKEKRRRKVDVKKGNFDIKMVLKICLEEQIN